MFCCGLRSTDGAGLGGGPVDDDASCRRRLGGCCCCCWWRRVPHVETAAVPTLFTYTVPTASPVLLCGSWDAWTSRTPMHRHHDVHTAQFSLLPGTYHYKCVCARAGGGGGFRGRRLLGGGGGGRAGPLFFLFLFLFCPALGLGVLATRWEGGGFPAGWRGMARSRRWQAVAHPWAASCFAAETGCGGAVPSGTLCW